jgi:hypothetical protein
MWLLLSSLTGLEMQMMTELVMDTLEYINIVTQTLIMKDMFVMDLLQASIQF